MNDTGKGDWLDGVLEQGLAPSVEENGFPRRVMAALPPARPRPWLRSAILLLTTVAACLVGLFVFPAGRTLGDFFLRVFDPSSWTSLPMAAGSLVVVIGFLWLAWSAATAEA